MVPVRAGWLVAHAKTQGTVARVQPPEVFESFLDVVDATPAHDVIAVFAPIGVLDVWVPGGRGCDREARALLGEVRGRAVVNAPTRPRLSAARHRHAAEINEHMQSFMQRVVHEVHPELTFFQLNGEQQTKEPSTTPSGRAERRALLGDRLEGLDRLFESALGRATPVRTLQAAAALWTARRLFARAATRLPTEPEWDSRGLQMAIAY